MGRYTIMAASVALIASTAVLFISKPSGPASKPVAAVSTRSFEGRISFLSSNSLRVGNQSLVLCGVVPIARLDKRIMAAAQGKYEKAFVRCNSVGSGTPCDGRTVSKVGNMVVAQCKMDGDVDLASALVEAGTLCGAVPYYKAC